MKIQISARISSGKNTGTELQPHKHKDGLYVASKTRFEKDYHRVDSVDDLIRYIETGHSVRMSAPGISPSLISPDSLKVSKL